MRKKLSPIAILIGLVVIAAIACSSSAPPPTASQPQSPPPPPPAQVPAPPAPTQPSGGNGVTGGTAFSVNLEDPGGSGEYAFDPTEMTFNVGDTIEFNLTSESEFHTFTVDDLGIDVEVDGGETTTYSFTFDQAGEFNLICIPHELLDMVGTITVQ